MAVSPRRHFDTKPLWHREVGSAVSRNQQLGDHRRPVRPTVSVLSVAGLSSPAAAWLAGAAATTPPHDGSTDPGSPVGTTAPGTARFDTALPALSMPTGEPPTTSPGPTAHPASAARPASAAHPARVALLARPAGVAQAARRDAIWLTGRRPGRESGTASPVPTSAALFGQATQTSPATHNGPGAKTGTAVRCGAVRKPGAAMRTGASGRTGAGPKASSGAPRPAGSAPLPG